MEELIEQILKLPGVTKVEISNGEVELKFSNGKTLYINWSEYYQELIVTLI